MADQLDHYARSSLEPHHVAALKLADALMTQPTGIDVALKDEVHRHFTDNQIIELTLDVMKWNYQKVAVSLGTDAEVSPGKLADLAFDEQGHWLPPTK